MAYVDFLRAIGWLLGLFAGRPLGRAQNFVPTPLNLVSRCLCRVGLPGARVRTGVLARLRLSPMWGLLPTALTVPRPARLQLTALSSFRVVSGLS